MSARRPDAGAEGNSRGRLPFMHRPVHPARLPAIAALCALLPAAAQEAAQRVERIEVTGSHLRRIDAEGPLPVSTITAEEIRATGFTTAAEVLERLPAVIGGYHVSLGVGDDSSPGLSAISLRGLGTTNTLVLVNGRRLSNYAFTGIGGGSVNLNQIPLAAIERIEVLRDGASAIYGTDAIAGVVNFILRRDFSGAEITGRAAWTERGGGRVRNATAAWGVGDIERQGYNVLVAADYQRSDVLKASQREFASTAVRPDLGLFDTSPSAFPANFVFDDEILNAEAAAGCAPSFGSITRTEARSRAAFRNACRYDFTRVLHVLPGAERLGLFGRAGLRLAGEHEAFLQYHFARNEVTYASSETPVADFRRVGSFRYPAAGPYYPTVVRRLDGTEVRPSGDLEVAWRLKAGGLRTNRVDSSESAAIAGVSGVVRGWDYAVALSHSRSSAEDNYVDGFVRESLLSQAIASGQVDVFSSRPLTPEAQAMIEAAKIREKVRESRASVTSLDAKTSGTVMRVPHGTLDFAVGVDHRRETLDDRPQEVMFSGDIQGAGGALLPTKADRTVSALFAEVNVPFAKAAEMQIAARHDRYSDFGGTTNPKAAIRWRPSEAVLMRASFGTGFRAPTLKDLFLPPTPLFTAEASDPARCPGGSPAGEFVDESRECAVIFPSRMGGNPELQPERSRQWTLGMVFEPSAGTSLGLDAWRIVRRNSIFSLATATIFDIVGRDDPLAAGGRFVRRPRSDDGRCADDADVPTPLHVPCPIDHVVNLLENVGTYRLTGVDVSAAWRAAPMPVGRISARFDGTYVARYRFQALREGELIANQGRFTDENGAVPRWRHAASVEWRRGAWSAGLLQVFSLGYREARGDVSRRVASHETWDLHGSWQGGRGLAVTIGVRNVFDRDPPATLQGRSFQVGYDPYLADPRGRTYHLALKYSLK